MTTQRRSYETGHKPKCLVIVDDTAEWDRAVYYASRWAIRVGGGVVMLRVIETEDQNQQWLGVADIMRAEAEEAANEALDRAAGGLKTVRDTHGRKALAGFGSPVSLRHHFGRAFGVSPSAWRQVFRG